MIFHKDFSVTQDSDGTWMLRSFANVRTTTRMTLMQEGPFGYNIDDIKYLCSRTDNIRVIGKSLYYRTHKMIGRTSC